MAIAHQKDVATVAGGVTSVVFQAALGADPVAISTWFFGAIDGLMARIQAGYALNRRSAMGFLPQHGALNGARVSPVPGSLDVGALRARLEITGPVGFKTAIGAGRDTQTALRSMATQMSGVADESVRDGDRDVITQTIRQGHGLLAYRRRLAGHSCGFCAMLASRGAVYGAESGNFRAHGHCRCWLEPVYRRGVEPPEVRRLQRQWQRVTAGQTGKDKARAWRRHWESGRVDQAALQGPIGRAVSAGIPGVGPAQLVPEVRASLLRPNTVRGLEQTWRSEMRAITGRDIAVGIPDGTSILTAREYAEGVLRGLERFPEANLTGVEFVSGLGANEYAHAVGGVIRFNARLANEANRPLVLSSLRGDVAKWEDGVGWSTRGDGTTTSMAVHEFGHIVDDTLGGRIHTEALLRMDTLARQAGLDTDTWVAREISAYSGSDAHEMVAEAFADVLMRGDAASIASKRIFEVLEREYLAGGYKGGPGVVARAVAAPDLTGARGLSSDVAVRRVQVENRIRQAWTDTPQSAGGWVSLADIRERVAMTGLTRSEVDAALMRLSLEPGVRLAPTDLGGRFWALGIDVRLRPTPREMAAVIESPRGKLIALALNRNEINSATLRALPAADLPLARRTVVQLRALAKERGVTIPTGAKKADIVRLLEAPPKTAPRILKTRPGATIGDVEAGPTQLQVALGEFDVVKPPVGDFVDRAYTGAVLSRGKPLPAGFDSPLTAIRRGKFELRPGLTADESQALDRYVLSRVADPLNTGLREGKTSGFGTARVADQIIDLDEEMRLLDSAISAGELARDTVLYRGALMRPFDLGKLQVGAITRESGFLSTSTDSQSAFEIIGWRSATAPPGRSRVVFEISAPKGTRAATGHTEEKEVLLGRDRRMRVTGITAPTRKGGTRIVRLELLPDELPATPLGQAAEAARAAQAVARDARTTAEALADVLSMVRGEASQRALAHRAASLLKPEGPLTEAARKAVAPLAKALQSGDAAAIQRAAKALERKFKLTRVDAGKTPTVLEGREVVSLDRSLHEVIGGQSVGAGERVWLVRPGYQATIDGRTVTLVKAQVQAIPADVIREAERKALREAARVKAAQIETATGNAKLLAEIDQLIAQKADIAVIRQRLSAKLIEREQLFAGADPAVRAALAAVADDPVKLRAALTRLGTKSKIKPISKAGTKTKFDADTMEPVGAEIKAGTQVTVVTRGSSVTLPDGTVVQIAKAKVTPVRAARPATGPPPTGVAKVDALPTLPKVQPAPATAKAINPGYGSTQSGPVYRHAPQIGNTQSRLYTPDLGPLPSGAYEENCTNVVLAWDMRMRGYDVRAAPINILDRYGYGAGRTEAELDDLLRRSYRLPGGAPHGRSMASQPWRSFAEIDEEILRDWPDGARGVMTVGKHIFNVTKVGGKVQYIEAQYDANASRVVTSLYKRKYKETSIFGVRVEEAKVVRVDDLVPADGILDAVRAVQ